MQRLSSLFSFLNRNTDRLLKIVQIAALLWVGYILQDISTTIYTGPSAYDANVSALGEIADKLDGISDRIQSLRWR